MGAGNSYYIWGFYGSLDSNGNMLMPEVNGYPGFISNANVKIFMAVGQNVKHFLSALACVLGMLMF